MKWISVKDELPPINDDCCGYDYVWVCGDGDPGTMMGLAQWRSDENKWNIMNDEGVYSDVGAFDLKSSEITHWAPFIYPKDDE